ncbi:MAG: glucose-1-phosphate cytidylyltransferase [Gemmatimonadetes bacterium]|jgi:glucose-1-phosphate cytidylyltransferase|nr:glucose-1-phosphate cytidylyltransferase [Gemmatimonadota bacterium]
MKAVILAGGLGTRLSEETERRPKPMVEIGGRPMLWHIMRRYAEFGINEFVVALGYKAEVAQRWFLDYRDAGADVTVHLGTREVASHATSRDAWTVHLVDTGLTTHTGGRLARLRPWIGDETFCMTYGDGIGDIDIGALIAFHRHQHARATVTAVRPPARFGSLTLDGTRVHAFAEKQHQTAEGWINGGFFVLEPSVLDLIADDDTQWEREPMETLAASGDLHAYRHEGFWQPMDTLRELQLLESLWQSGNAPWLTTP